MNLPNPPTDIKTNLSIQNGSGIVNVTWTDKSSNENGFRIEGRAREEADYKTIAAIDKDQSSFLDTMTPIDKTYYYRVNAFNANGDSVSAQEGLRLGLLSKIEKKNISDYAVKSGILYLLWQEGLTPVNVTDPLKPKLARTFPLMGFVQKGFIRVSHDMLYIIDDKKLFVMSIKNPLSPSFISALDIDGDNVDMEVLENTIYILKSDGLLDIIDAKYAHKPTVKRFIKIKGSPKNIIIDDGYLAVAIRPYIETSCTGLRDCDN